MSVLSIDPILNLKAFGGKSIPPPGYDISKTPLVEPLDTPYPPPFIFKSRAAAVAIYLVPPGRLAPHLPDEYRPLSIFDNSVVAVMIMHFHYVGRADGFKPVVDGTFNEICYFSPVNVNGLIGLHAYRMELNHPDAVRFGREQAGWPKLLQDPVTQIGIDYLRVENRSDHPLEIEFEKSPAIKGLPLSAIAKLFVRPAIFNAAPFLFPWPREGVLTMPDQRFLSIKPAPAEAHVTSIDFLTSLDILTPGEILKPAVSYLFREIKFVIDDSIFFVKK